MTGMHLLVLVAVLLLLFGATKLPALARSIGQSMRILRTETRSLSADESGADDKPRASAADPSAAAESTVGPTPRN
ncbi:sec-independent protein translocase protein TatA [Microbacterium ulmi]|nr:sec-independent protein translocase protein TatA [Microbacterium ulmi]